MKHCVNCGEEINEKAVICTECGVNQSTSLEGSHGDRRANEKYCIECAELINHNAEICPECGVPQERTGGVSPGAGDSSSTGQQTAGILAILLGGIGAHKFYQGRTGLGILYLCFSWSGIPVLIGLVEGIMILLADEQEYEEKYADGDIFGS